MKTANYSHLRTPNSAMNFSVAPMLDLTDANCRYFHRLLTKKAWLYSEMVTTGAIIYGENNARFLKRYPEDTPVILQLGGSQPEEMAQCAKIGEEWGYDEININVGCPSDRVQNNAIGACLMSTPQIVAECVQAMKAVTTIPITVKCRIGIDEQDEESSIREMLAALQAVDVDGVIIHARKAWLQGLSPKENRHVPPLNYDLVRQMKQEFPNLPIAINGGLTTIEQGLEVCHVEAGVDLDGFMMGRTIYEKPFMLTEVDSKVYGDEYIAPDRFDIIEQMIPFVETHLQSEYGKLIQVSRHMLGLFAGLPGGRMWRRFLSQEAFKKEASAETLREAAIMVKDEMARMEIANQERAEKQQQESQ